MNYDILFTLLLLRKTQTFEQQRLPCALIHTFPIIEILKGMHFVRKQNDEQHHHHYLSDCPIMLTSKNYNVISLKYTSLLLFYSLDYDSNTIVCCPSEY